MAVQARAALRSRHAALVGQGVELRQPGAALIADEPGEEVGDHLAGLCVVVRPKLVQGVADGEVVGRELGVADRAERALEARPLGRRKAASGGGAWAGRRWTTKNTTGTSVYARLTCGCARAIDRGGRRLLENPSRINSLIDSGHTASVAAGPQQGAEGWKILLRQIGRGDHARQPVRDKAR
ncbi:hypothetical protein [Bradyrhizobium sp. P5_C11_2]